ncbi:aminotransferase class V-fold PLP-dependent enzyme [Nordella sp. HKS 07]|uniref:aminotransferase class V-fold PLP-dependent enzyme n=1 Tax=Nordella sp. HKS 07 TaxID=2712222 RepID=UPI0013E1ED42|nr:aminotransferase class V-fold PLP-dependent enzyme [Nordella sp. HKS 07]QIG46650.1 aminotransferase class V-fold PLP-dependent enzyme [Nordella sp. HKS 07]
MLVCQKDKFALPRHIAYLDAAYMSPIPLAALEAGKVGTAVKTEPWKMTIASYYDEVEEARALAASLIGADAEDIAIAAATSYGMAVAARNVPVPPGSAILLMENEHPSHRYIWHELAEQRRAHVRIIDKPSDGDWTAAFVKAIADCDIPVAVVAGTMVHWFEGTAINLTAVTQASRAAGACLVVDGTQWVGALPFDVKTVRPDFLVFATYKFLLGPYRLAFLYADKRWHGEGKPIEHHSWNRVGGDKSDFYRVEVPAFLPGARRFDMGERSDFAVMPVAIESLKLLNGWGVENTFARLRHLNDLAWKEAVGRELIREPNPLRAPHISILDFGDHVPPDLATQLRANNVYVTVRGSKVRISPHVYNDEQDILALFNLLASILKA